MTTVTELSQFLQVFGFFLFLIGGYLGFLAWESGRLKAFVASLRQTAEPTGSIVDRRPSRVTISLCGIAVLLTASAALIGLWVSMIAVAVVILAILFCTRNKEWEGKASDRFVLLVIGVGSLLILVTESVYVRDAFDGTTFYRMNTVFKFYFQIWFLLGLAGAFAAFRLWRAFSGRTKLGQAALTIALVFGVALGGVYTLLGPVSYFGALNGGPVRMVSQGLDGISWMESTDKSDYLAIVWMQSHIHGNPVVLEATGPDYSMLGRVSTYTGLATLLGWEGHEEQWRTDLPIIAARHSLIDRIYATADWRLARKLLRANHVSLVYVGPCERAVYGNSAAAATLCGSDTRVASAPGSLLKFGQFMRPIYRRDGVVVYRLKR